MTDDDTRIDELIERSSLGTAGARQLRNRTPLDAARNLLDDPATLANESRDAAALLDDGYEPAHDTIHAAVELIRPLILRYCRARLQRSEEAAEHVASITDNVCADIERDLIRRPDLAEESKLLSHAYRLAGQHLHTPPPIVHRPHADNEHEHERTITAEVSSALAAAVDRLDEIEREVIVLRVVVGLSATETAEALGLRPAAVRRLQHSALRALRRQTSL